MIAGCYKDLKMFNIFQCKFTWTALSNNVVTEQATLFIHQIDLHPYLSVSENVG